MGSVLEQLDAGEVAVFWSHDETRRVIVDLPYADTKTTLLRVLRRFRGGINMYRTAQASLGNLLCLADPSSYICREAIPQA